MTTAVFRRTDHEWAIDICGHAGYSKGGPDIVCSACSVLTCTLVQCVKELEAKGAIAELADAEHSGDVKMSFKALRAEPHTVVHTVMSGFMLLECSYPKHVRYVYTSAQEGGADCGFE